MQSSQLMPTETTMILNEAQSAALNEVAEAELRTPEQMLSLLLAEGIRFYFCDYRSAHGEIDQSKLEDALTEDAKLQLLAQ